MERGNEMGKRVDEMEKAAKIIREESWNAS